MCQDPRRNRADEPLPRAMEPTAQIDPPPPEGPTPRRHFRLGLALASTVVALLAGEGLLRLTARRPPQTQEELLARLERSRSSPTVHKDWDGLTGLVQPGSAPSLPYELRPNLDGTFLRQKLRTNSWGLRSAEVERAKGAGVVRIVGLGDSHMFGWGVAQDELYLALIEQRLNASAPAGRRFEVLNCAVPGYNTVLEVAQFEARCAAFAPDLVVLHVVGNDLDLPHFLRRSEAPPISYLWAALKGLVRTAEPGDEEEIPELIKKPGPGKTEGRRADAMRRSAHLAGAEAATSALDRLAALLGPTATPVVVLTMGDDGPARETLLPRAAAHGWPVIDAWPPSLALLEERGLPADLKTWRSFFRVQGKDHPSVAAHQLFADLLWSELVRLGMAPASEHQPEEPHHAPDNGGDDR